MFIALIVASAYRRALAFGSEVVGSPRIRAACSRPNGRQCSDDERVVDRLRLAPLVARQMTDYSNRDI
jgi:hypothetical protein